MPREYRVVDCRSGVIHPTEINIVADTPEHAARLAMGEDLMRGGGTGGPKALKARVYCGVPPNLTMVRLYAKPQVEDNREQLKPNRWGD